MKNKIKAGDLVKLKSGSPLMTVACIDKGLSVFYNSEKCVCEYWEFSVFKKVTVFVNSLIKVENEN